MKKQTFCAVFLLSASLAMAANDPEAVKDVTTQYVTNYSFESDELSDGNKVTESADGLRGYKVTAPTGWTLSGEYDKSYLVNQDCYTDNNFGKMTTIADGSVAYYLRRGWSAGKATLQQTLKNLPAGKYKLTADVRSAYNGNATSSFSLFANNDGMNVVTSGKNTNTSLTGIKVGEVTDYRYPSAQNKWEQIVYDFTLSSAQEVDLSLGYSTTSGAGAANNTLLYIDNLRLGAKVTTDIRQPGLYNNVEHTNSIYDLNGVRIEKPGHGIYIVNGKKIVVNK